jgi:hypothetical protein
VLTAQCPHPAVDLALREHVGRVDALRDLLSLGAVADAPRPIVDLQHNHAYLGVASRNANQDGMDGREHRMGLFLQAGFRRQGEIWDGRYFSVVVWNFLPVTPIPSPRRAVGPRGSVGPRCLPGRAHRPGCGMRLARPAVRRTSESDSTRRSQTGRRRWYVQSGWPRRRIRAGARVGPPRACCSGPMSGSE